MSSRRLRGALTLLYAIAFGALGYFAWAGSAYYLTPVLERPRHELYWLYKPGGTLGLAFGIVGASLMIAMLLYSVRKRVAGLRRFAHLKSWLHFHIFCGVVGPLFIVLHSSFKVQGLVSLSFWSMVVVALSGFVGRYLYGLIPRARSGDELTLAEATDRIEGLRERLQCDFHLSDDELSELAAITGWGLGGDRRRKSLLTTLMQLPFHGLLVRLRLRRLAGGIDGPGRSVAGDLGRNLARAATLERRVRLWDEGHRLFYYWHLFHKPFSIIMYVFMAIHIAVAVATGYGGF